MQKNKRDVKFYLFEQSKDYNHTEDKKKYTNLTWFDRTILGIYIQSTTLLY